MELLSRNRAIQCTQADVAGATKLCIVVTTPANVANSTVLPDLSHGKRPGYGDQAYRGEGAAIRQRAAKVQDFVNRPTTTAASWMKSTGRKTAPNPECGLGSNMQSG